MGLLTADGRYLDQEDGRLPRCGRSLCVVVQAGLVVAARLSECLGLMVEPPGLAGRVLGSKLD